MNRALLIGGFFVVLLVCAVVLSCFINNPVEGRRAALEERLQTIAAADDTYEATFNIAYNRLETAILAKPSLWQPLIRPPEQPTPPPNLEEMLGNVILTRHRMGAGNEMKVKILVVGEAGEKPYWIKKGDIVNGLTVKEVTADYVVFSLIHAGKEQTAKLLP